MIALLIQLIEYYLQINIVLRSANDLDAGWSTEYTDTGKIV